MNRLIRTIMPRDSTEFAFAVIVSVGLIFLIVIFFGGPLEECV